MGNFLVRITITLVAFYFLLSYLVTFFTGIDILYYTYTLLFELCVVVFTFSAGKYHCKYMKWTALSVLFVDVISHADNYFNFIPVDYFFVIPISILALGIGTSVTLAIRHFIQVIRLNNERRKIISNQEDSVSTYRHSTNKDNDRL